MWVIAATKKGGLAISYAAAAMGITSLERHFTLDRSMYAAINLLRLHQELLKI